MTKPRIYLNSFNPLCCNKIGLKAIENYNFPNYIDGSCRREPDFENEFPSITGLCRPGFAEKLNEKDIIVYVTNKKGIGSRKIVAVLEVTKMFENHRQAADWYIKENKVIPQNIMVNETTPFDLDKTHRIHRLDETNENIIIPKWDTIYKLRSREKSKVAQCKILYKELNFPFILDKSKFERKLIAQNPPVLNNNEWEIIKELIKL
jgi:hypothetical protein